MKLDLRSLAIFRMVLGLVVFSQALFLARDFEAFYSTAGVLQSPEGSENFLRLLLFGILPLFAVFLSIGLFTRLSTLLCFGMLIMVQNANPQILQGGDVLLRLLLFWSLFLPLGQVWSMDARWKLPVLSLPWTICLASWAITFQICFVYWFAALLKSDPLWTQNGNALFYALNIEHFTTPFGLYLRQYPDLLRVMTFATLCLEIGGPCLLFLPFRRDVFRLAAVIFFIGFHLMGMQSLLRIGLFPWVCATAWLIFIPGSFWDWVEGGINQSREFKKSKTKAKQTAIIHESAVPLNSRTFPLDYVGAVLVGLFFMDVAAWNLASLEGVSFMRWMQEHDVVGNTLRLDQRWNMYAPHPRQEHGWLVVPADLAEGQQIDLFTGQPVSWDKPEDLGAYFGDDRWRRYLSNLFDERDPKALQGYADYLVRRWSQHHGPDQKIQAVTIIFMRQVTMPDLTVTPPEKEILYFKAF